MSSIVFTCDNCGSGSANTAGVLRMEYDPSIKIIRVPCAGRVGANFVMEAFSDGADAVSVVGCCLGACHYSGSNFVTMRRLKILKKLFEQLGYDPDRINYYTARAAEGDTFVGDAEDIIKKSKSGERPFDIILKADGKVGGV